MFQTTNQQLLTAVQLLQVSLFDVIILKLRQNCHAGCSGFHDNGDVSRAINIITPGITKCGQGQAIFSERM